VDDVGTARQGRAVAGQGSGRAGTVAGQWGRVVAVEVRGLAGQGREGQGRAGQPLSSACLLWALPVDKRSAM